MTLETDDTVYEDVGILGWSGDILVFSYRVEDEPHWAALPRSAIAAVHFASGDEAKVFHDSFWKVT